ncbi:MAG: hypothetical protein WD005_04890, partial [Haliea sp.]
MSTDTIFTNLVRYDWLIDSPLESVISSYIAALRDQRYAEPTIRAYLGCLAHFGFWLKAQESELAHVNSPLVKRFLREHLPNCNCPAPCYNTVGSSGAALRHLLRMSLSFPPLLAMSQSPVTEELARFDEYLTSIR